MATTLKPKRKSRSQAQRPAAETPLAAKTEDAGERPIWETVAELGSQISDAEWEEVPDDSSINYKHYLHGTPAKRA